MKDKIHQLNKDLIERYKKGFANISIKGPYQEGKQANELYKWELITVSKGKSPIQILQDHCNNPTQASKGGFCNLIDAPRDNKTLKYLLENKKEVVNVALEELIDENRPLEQRLSDYKIKLVELLPQDGYNSKANDERTAAAFLTCVNPEKYTFYKDEIYQSYCKYIGESPQRAGEKYPHYLQLLQTLVQAITQDAELMEKYQTETNGLIQSDLLIAQNILWQMKDKIKMEEQFRYWSGGIKWDDGNTNKLEDFNSDGYWQIGWDKNDGSKGAKQAWKNIKKVRIGDYLAFHGYGGRNDLTIYQVSRVVNKDEENGKLYFEKLNGEKDDLFHGKAPKMDKGTWWGTLFPVTGQEAIDCIFGRFVEKEKRLKNKVAMEIELYKNILSLKKNIILQGAPGTGKTYNTAALALSICGEPVPDKHEDVMKRYEELQKEGRIGFVTFHQSMDYEDFVEGIKPKTENGTITYDVEDGIFKALSNKARENYEDSQKTIEVLQKQKSIQDKMNDFLVNAQESRTEYQTKTGSKFIITEITDKNVIIEIPENQITSRLSISLPELTELLENEVVLNNVKDIKVYFNRKFNIQRDSYTFVIANEIKKIKTKTVEVQKTELKNHVLIIDEINRGNVSKIFGELITLLEADKRLGGAHPIKVTLPYSKEEFGVPSNLYIIGTMNTTDRSVGNIDYAVRRRFAFVTLESKREIVAEQCGEDSKAVKLFDKVKEFLEKHKFEMDIEDLMVGHSYFMAADEEELKLKLEYEIVPLIREYHKDGIINAKKEDLENEITNWKNQM